MVAKHLAGVGRARIAWPTCSRRGDRLRLHPQGPRRMSAESSARLILIVTGSTLRAEEVDRPLAYYLKQQVEQQVARRVAEGTDDEAAQVLVIADFRWMSEEPLQVAPTISVGGPGVNALAHRWFEDLPFSLAVDEQYCIQMDPELAEARASLWGMDNPTTQIAVSIFVDRFLPHFLDRAAEPTPEPDDNDATDSESDED